MDVLLTIPYVKKCFSREFVSKLPLFCAQTPAEITNRKFGVSSKTGILTFIHIVARAVYQKKEFAEERYMRFLLCELPIISIFSSLPRVRE
ncbi:hypothetical protein M2137_001676 [Parabacteroides sp. PFB2-10]|nr:hypothetical protein [Parabacteroides sp. PFB2-10]